MTAFILFLNTIAMWLSLGRALNPELDMHTRKVSAWWAGISFVCAVVNLSLLK